jgi:uncharacterized membrane protein YeiH
VCVVAVLAGAAVAVACVKLGRFRAQAMAVGMAACFVLRIVAGWQHWYLPIPHLS